DVPAPPAATEPQQAGGDGDGAGGGNGDGDGASAGGGGSEEKETKAPEKTAATAVQQMAAKEPGKRHICYRIYVADQGWSDVACDGETAGEEGSGKPTTAVNIAVFGTKGTSSGAFLPNPASTDGTGKYFDPWSSVDDGVDNYVGSTKKDAPHMLGFSINVDDGAGAVCQNSYVHNGTWIGLVCDTPGEGLTFTYVGAFDNDLWIEAIRLTV
ncbi:hydrolase, partial [Streptomyces sp. NPDC015220]